MQISMVGKTMNQSKLAECFKKATGFLPQKIQLMSGARTNSNYRVIANGNEYAMRIPGDGTNDYIDRLNEVSNLEKVSDKFDFVPNVIFADSTSGILITEFLTGARSLDLSDVSDSEVIKGIASRLALVHNSGIEFSNIFDLPSTKRNYEKLLMDKQSFDGLPRALVKETSDLEAALIEYEREYGGKLSPCHGDPNMGNFMLRQHSLYLIDWEYSGMCNPLFDLANMVMTDRLDSVVEGKLLRQYEEESCSEIDPGEYLLLKVAIDYMWIFWHLIKLSQGVMAEYNERSWRNRLVRALDHLREIG